jgi:hypothetical protein
MKEQPEIKTYPPKYCDGYVHKPWHEETLVSKTFFAEMREARAKHRANKKP